MDEWRRSAACLDYPTTWFYEPEWEHVVREVCRECPVRLACLRCALRNSEHHGIWGGLTESGRRRMAQRVGRNPSTEALARELRRMDANMAKTRVRTPQAV